jgi:hypothetical protein
MTPTFDLRGYSPPIRVRNIDIETGKAGNVGSEANKT